jgi:proline iminopeptidase
MYRAVVAERTEFIEVSGGRLWAATSGTGVPLLLCHGGPGAYDYLSPVAEMVDDIAQVHRFDQRGGGRSVTAGPWTVAAMLNDIETLRAHWGHEQWLIAGQSWGAHLALFYSLAFPNHTLGLICLNSTGLMWGWGPERRANRIKHLTPPERAEVARLESELRVGGDKTARERLRELMWLADFADRDTAARHERYDAYPRDAAVIEALERDWERELSGIDARIGKLHLPALVLHGEADPIGLAGPCELAHLLPDGRLVILPQAGHVPWLENPSDLRCHLRAFIAKLNSSEPSHTGT